MNIPGIKKSQTAEEHDPYIFRNYASKVVFCRIRVPSVGYEIPSRAQKTIGYRLQNLSGGVWKTFRTHSSQDFSGRVKMLLRKPDGQPGILERVCPRPEQGWKFCTGHTKLSGKGTGGLQNSEPSATDAKVLDNSQNHEVGDTKVSRRLQNCRVPK